MSSLGQAYVQIVPKATGISNQIESLVTPGANKAGVSAGSGIAGGIKKAIAAAGIGVAIKNTIGAALSEGGKLQQSYGGLDTIYGDAAEAAKKYASEAAKAGISANDYAEQAVSFGASLKQAFEGDTTKAVEAANTAIMDMTDNAAKMGTPIENIQNAYQGFAKQNYTMLDNLKLGYGGTKTEMERLLADAEKLPAAMGRSFDINNLGDVYEAIHLIQGDLQLTGVAAEEAEKTFSGSFGAMKASWDNLLGAVALGEGVDSALQTFVTNAGTFLFNNAIPMLQTVFQSIGSMIPGMLDSLWQTIFGEPLNIDLGAMFEGVKESVSGVIDSFTEVASSLIPMNSEFSLSETIATALSTAMNALSGALDFIAEHMNIILPIIIGVVGAFVALKTAMAISSLISGVAAAFSLILSPVGLVVAAIAAAIAIGILLYQNWDTVKEKASEIWESIKETISGVWEAITSAVKGAVDTVRTKISDGFNAAKTTVSNVFNGIKSTVSSIWDGIKNKVSSVVNSIKSTVSSVFNSVKSTVSSIWNGIKSAITKPIDSARKAVSDGISKIKGVFKGLNLELPHPKLPHFRISGGEPPWGIMGKGTKPTVSIDWYAKGGIVDGATLIGAGEAGPEAIVPLSGGAMKPFAKAIADEMPGNGDITINLNYDASDDAVYMLRDVARGIRRYRMAGAF